MPRPRVYVETTIPSYYFDERLTPEIVRRREVTRTWWATANERYELMTGAPVLQELAAGPAHMQHLWMKLIRDLPVLAPAPPISSIYAVYRAHRLMPAGETGDGYHLAYASHYKCDILATWNFKHLANPNKFVHIRKVNASLGLPTPRIASPFDL
jgi:predicted nucleic acid-binding protein